MYSDLPEATELTVESGRADLYNTLSSIFSFFFSGIWAPSPNAYPGGSPDTQHPHRLTTKQADTPQLSPSTLQHGSQRSTSRPHQVTPMPEVPVAVHWTC